MTGRNSTPWNFNPKAAERVRDRFPIPTQCPYCFGPVEITPHELIYGGRKFGAWPWMYCCVWCGARVGMHPFTNLPLGTLADAPTRAARTACKPYFLTVEKIMRDRSRAYSWLAKQLDLPLKKCHFGLFTVEQCHAAREVCTTFILEQGFNLPAGAPSRHSD